MTYALCYFSCQASTIREKHVVLLDTSHWDRRSEQSFFMMRHLIVGLSRVTHGDFVHIPTEAQETELLEAARVYKNGC